MTTTVDVAIVGGGIIGLAIAEALLHRGVRPVVFERNVPPVREASWAAIGFLRHRISTDDPYGWLSRTSAERYPDWVARLREASGVDPEYRRDGGLELALTKAKEESLRRMAALHSRRGIPVTWMEADALRTLEPMLGPDVRGGNFYANDAQVRPPRLLKALAHAVSDRGGVLHFGQTVQRLEWQDGRCVGLWTTRERVDAGAVVLAAGCWSGLLARAEGIFLPVRPVRGQVVQLDAGTLRIGHTVSGAGVHLGQRQDGTLLVGATVEEVGFHADTTPEGAAILREAAAQLIPALRDRPVIRHWAGLRPAPARRYPYLGELRPGLWVATGHFRIGILLAPATAEVIAEALATGRSPIPLDRFHPDRDRERVERMPHLLPTSPNPG